MLADIHRGLTQLLYRHGNLDQDEVEVRFDMPTRQWIDSLVRPTVSFYLFEIVENTDLRETGHYTVRNSGHSERRVPPRRFDLRYMVSAPTTEVEDEHILLWRTLATLLRFSELPPDVLPGGLNGLEPPLAGRIEKSEESARVLDLWRALEAPPRPSLLYVVTAPLDLDVVFRSPLVLTRTARYAQEGSGQVAEVGTQIGGTVRDKSGGIIVGAAVSIAGHAYSVLTDANGRFVLPGIRTGPIKLRIALGGRNVREYTLEVPSDSYELIVD